MHNVNLVNRCPAHMYHTVPCICTKRTKHLYQAYQTYVPTVPHMCTKRTKHMYQAYQAYVPTICTPPQPPPNPPPVWSVPILNSIRTYQKWGGVGGGVHVSGTYVWYTWYICLVYLVHMPGTLGTYAWYTWYMCQVHLMNLSGTLSCM